MAGSTRWILLALLVMAGAYWVSRQAGSRLKLLGLSPANATLAMLAMLGTAALVALKSASSPEESATVVVLVSTAHQGAPNDFVADVVAFLRARGARTRVIEAPEGHRQLMLAWAGPGAVRKAEGVLAEGRRHRERGMVVLPRSSRAAGRAVHGHFVRVERAQDGTDGTPVDGGWTPFTEWTACVPLVPGGCGAASGGTQHRSRTCTMPRAQNGGRPCQGEGRERRDCRVECTGGGG